VRPFEGEEGSATQGGATIAIISFSFEEMRKGGKKNVGKGGLLKERTCVEGKNGFSANRYRQAAAFKIEWRGESGVGGEGGRECLRKGKESRDNLNKKEQVVEEDRDFLSRGAEFSQKKLKGGGRGEGTTERCDSLQRAR